MRSHLSIYDPCALTEVWLLARGGREHWAAGEIFDRSAAHRLRRKQVGIERARPLVLVAEDEPVIAETLVEILQGEGFDALAVRDGEAAVEAAQRLLPDILLADVMMPRLNGIEAAKQISEFASETRIVLLSGQAETTELLREARDAGYDFPVLAKPVKPSVLLQVLRGGAE